MNAERLRPQDQAFSRLGGDLAPSQKPADARDDSAGFRQHRVRFLSRNERPIIAIGAVGEGLLPCDQSSSTRKTRNPAAGPRVNFDSWPAVFYLGRITL